MILNLTILSQNYFGIAHLPSDCEACRAFLKAESTTTNIFCAVLTKGHTSRDVGLAEMPWCFCCAAAASLCCLCAFTTQMRARVRICNRQARANQLRIFDARARALSVAITHETQLSPRLCGRQTCYSRILLFYYMQYSKLN